MKKNIFKILFCLLVFGKLAAQNLVLNPSFETFTGSCGFAGYGSLVNWYNPSPPPIDSCSSPDWYATCGSTPFNKAPNANFGYQVPHTGNAYAAFILKDGSTANYREYVEGKFSSPLTAGQTYCVSFYISLGNKAYMYCNNFGAYISNTLTTFPWNNCNSTAPLPYTPQINYTCTITDTSNWVRVQGNYTAVGGEQYITLGNFFNDGATTSGNNPGGSFFSGPFAYYYIDDVSVEPGACCFANIVPQAPLCVTGSTITLAATGSGSGSCAQAASGTWSGAGITNSVTGVFSPSVAGAGTHVISFSLSCGYVATTTITVNACATLSVCATSNTLTVSGGTPSYTWSVYNPGGSTPITTQAQCTACNSSYLWFGGTCLNGVMPVTSCSTAPSWQQVATGASYASTGTFPVKVQDAAGNSYTVTSLSAVPACSTPTCPTLSLSITSQTNVSCFGQSNGSATVSASGGTGPYTYTWSPGNLNGTVQNNLAAGIYTINFKDANNCTGTGTVTITQPSTLSVSITSTTAASCGQNNGSATALATGGTTTYTYNWSPSGGSSATANNLAGGNYTVTVTDAHGCIATTTTSISSAGAPTVTVNSATICSGSTTTLTASGSSSYTWTPSTGLSSTTGSSVTVNTPSTTIYVVTAGSGTCTAFATATVTVNQTPTVSINPAQVICTGSPVSFTLNTNATSYNWSGPNSYTSAVQNPSIATTTTLNTGLYTATVTLNNCSATVSTSVTVTSAATASIVSHNPVCSNAPSFTFTTANPGGTWSGTGITNTATGTFDPSVSGVGTFTVHYVIGGSCGASDSTTITVKPNPTLTVSATQTLCAGGTINLNSVSSATIVSWTGPNGYTSNVANPVINNASSSNNGTYSVTVTSGGCSSSGAVTISVSPVPNASVSPQSALCINHAPVTLTAATSGGTWSGTGITNITTGVFDPSVSGAGTFTVTYSLGGSCPSSSVTVITVNALPAVNATAASNTVCSGQAINLNSGISGGTYNWSGPNSYTSSAQNPVINNASATNQGTYSVTVTINGCSSNGTVSIAVTSSPTLITAGNYAICNGGADTLMVSGALNYTWSPSTGLNVTTGDTVIAHPSVSTNYTVTGINASGCTASITVPVVISSISASLNANPLTGDSPLSVNFGANTGAASYHWNFGNGQTLNTLNDSAAMIYTQPGTYTASVLEISTAGCVDSAKVVIVVNEGFAVVIPNIFTPNGDNINDFFTVKHTGVKDMDVTIIDRWGIQMYGSSSLTTGWDGKYNGKDASEGTYFYIIKLTTAKGESKNYNGTLTLAR